MSRNNIPVIKRSLSYKMNICEEEQYASNDILKEESFEETLTHKPRLYSNVLNNNEISNTLEYIMR